MKLNDLMTDLQFGTVSVSQWRTKFGQEIDRLHSQSLDAGLNDGYPNEPADMDSVSPRAQSVYHDKVMLGQLGFLDKWTLQIQSDSEFQEGWRQRAAMYALAVKQDYWAGKTRLLPLPAMPGDGTSQCLSNCDCSWNIVWYPNGDADAYWVLGPVDHCQTCKIRAGDWAPLRIRDGNLQ